MKSCLPESMHSILKLDFLLMPFQGLQPRLLQEVLGSLGAGKKRTQSSLPRGLAHFLERVTFQEPKNELLERGFIPNKTTDSNLQPIYIG